MILYVLNTHTRTNKSTYMYVHMHISHTYVYICVGVCVNGFEYGYVCMKWGITSSSLSLLEMALSAQEGESFGITSL